MVLNDLIFSFRKYASWTHLVLKQYTFAVLLSVLCLFFWFVVNYLVLNSLDGFVWYAISAVSYFSGPFVIIRVISSIALNQGFFKTTLVDHYNQEQIVWLRQYLSNNNLINSLDVIVDGVDFKISLHGGGNNTFFSIGLPAIFFILGYFVNSEPYSEEILRALVKLSISIFGLYFGNRFWVRQFYQLIFESDKLALIRLRELLLQVKLEEG